MNCETKKIELRNAKRSDCAVIYGMVGEMIADWVPGATPRSNAKAFEHLLFDEHGASGIIAYYEGQPAGYCFYTYSASSLNCMRSITMENFFVRPALRRKGIGSAMLDFMKEKTIEEGLLGLEWFARAMSTEEIAFFAHHGQNPEAVRISYHWNNGNHA